MKECQKKVKNILAICWGLQVCSTAAGGKVNPGKNGAHIGGDKGKVFKSKFVKFFKEELLN